jgi:hypothetical protein
MKDPDKYDELGSDLQHQGLLNTESEGSRDPDPPRGVSGAALFPERRDPDLEAKVREGGMQVHGNVWQLPAPVPMSDGALLATALASAQAEFPPIPRSRTVTVNMEKGGSYEFSYAPLETILSAVRGPLTRFGFSLTQQLFSNDKGEFVRTVLLHRFGAFENQVPVLPGWTSAAKHGAQITYARRYGVSLLLCIAADDDNDASTLDGAEPAAPPRAAEPRRKPREERPDDRAPQPPSGDELVIAEGKIADAIQELVECAVEGKSRGISQIWDAIKTDDYIARMVWSRLQEGDNARHFATIKSVVRPEGSRAPRGPKP